MTRRVGRSDLHHRTHTALLHRTPANNDIQTNAQRKAFRSYALSPSHWLCQRSRICRTAGISPQSPSKRVLRSGKEYPTPSAAALEGAAAGDSMTRSTQKEPSLDEIYKLLQTHATQTKASFDSLHSKTDALAARVDSLEKNIPEIITKKVETEMKQFEVRAAQFIIETVQSQLAGAPTFATDRTGSKQRRNLTGKSAYYDSGSLIAFGVPALATAKQAAEAITQVVSDASGGSLQASFLSVEVRTEKPRPNQAAPTYNITIGVTPRVRGMLFRHSQALKAIGITFRDDLTPAGRQLKQARNAQFLRLRDEGRKPKWLGPYIEYQRTDGMYYMVSKYDVSDVPPPPPQPPAGNGAAAGTSDGRVTTEGAGEGSAA
ncbi:hypothetical protein VOLCADRAFT_100239 [Volvox carteri f. nagariensis]|uniref:Uncharacterized protein n=1 Tax=Volvox carteri f. nagariensis TaxID=3068 RepID=D8UJS7_VOLCA|nr:uncharacterized protein VOLCADRAFT_100239 [Volvox carteri f. nagariensis]EFJ40028.1 hypothetical protein VOLCADRAFT_100239 [Volvox carteri f. nagariensis]|eukprot:XP_002958897.1 hypothetical protein VOLCADRAFT_100239 [Volvox carteri f. nagariensis]